MGKILKWLALDHRSLGQQRLFWIAMGLPVALFFIFGLFSWIESSPQWDYKGFNHFIEKSKLALGLLTLALPFTALVTSWHRSIQTARQIEEAQVKNTADLYYAHLRFFIDHLKGNDLVFSPIGLHQDLYPNFSSSHYSLAKNETVIEGIKNLLDGFNKTINEWIKEETKSNNLNLLMLLAEIIKQNLEITSKEWISTHHIALRPIEFKNLRLIAGHEETAEEIFNKALADLNSLSDLVNM